MSKSKSGLLFISGGVVAILAMASIYLERLETERTVVFQIHSAVTSEFALLVDNKPEFFDGVNIRKHGAGPDLWEFRVPVVMSRAQREQRKARILDKIRNWLAAGTQISPQIGLVVHHGAENVTIDRIDEWPAPVVELLSEGASSGSAGSDD